jgi:hypothetical protein
MALQDPGLENARLHRQFDLFIISSRKALPILLANAGTAFLGVCSLSTHPEWLSLNAIYKHGDAVVLMSSGTELSPSLHL